jgi:hypothetical protein
MSEQMREVVGAQIGTTITNIPAQIAAAVEAGTVSRFLFRDEMKLMAALDLGMNWTNLANSRTLFLLSDDGKTAKPATP